MIDERMMDEAEGSAPESPLDYARRIRAMVHEAASHYSPSRIGGEMMNTALDLYAVALTELFGERWREYTHPENGDVLALYIQDSARWESNSANRSFIA